MRPVRNILFQEYLAEQKKSPEFREAWAKYELAHQIVRLRIARGLTQAQLAERVGTTQSSIARLESGSREPSLSFLRRVVKALDGQLEVRVVSEEIDAETYSEESVEFPVLIPTHLLPAIKFGVPHRRDTTTEAVFFDGWIPPVLEGVAQC